MIRRSTGWRGGPRRLARPLVRGRRAGRRRTGRPGEPATPCRAAAGRPAPRPCARPSAANLGPQLDSNTPVLRRGPQPGSETPPDGNRRLAEVQSTQLKSRQPALTRLVGARFRHHAKGAAACPASIAVGSRSMHRQCIGCLEARNASVSRRDVSSGHRRGLQGPPCWASRPPRSRRCPGIRIMKRTAGCSWGWSGFYSHVERGRAKLTRYGPSPATTIPDS
jgi:hypothetical protein